MANADHFFSRWSRRKTAAVQGRPVEELPTPPTLPEPAAKPTPVVTPEAPAAEELAPPTLTLEDAQALTPESDFKPFIARNVTPEVKNAAMKKLFSDPHYNVMDRLDIYIDDYSQPDPLPVSMLRQMASAKFLKLFEDEEEPAGQKEQRPGDDANTVGTADVSQSAASVASTAEPIKPLDLTVSTPMTAQTPANPDDHAHADLRLQPHHAALGPQFGESAEREPGASQRVVPP